MSGIAGILRLDGEPVGCRDVERMVGAMTYRGPHRSGSRTLGRVGLGQCALHSTPESEHEQQPLTRGPFTIVADARLDYRDDLIRALGLARDGEIITDVELILLAFEKWSDDCVHHLEGDFAFALWDERTQRLFCARDHFGIRPFYYVQSTSLFAFASDINALLCLDEIPERINEVRIADFLISYTEGYDEEVTFYEDIRRMPPAHLANARDGRVSLQRYWQMEAPPPIRLASDEEYAEAFMSVFTGAVKSRLRGLGPPASMLSGGLDSSAVVAVARKLTGGALHTFSAVTDDPDCLESSCARAVIAQGGVHGHEIFPESRSSRRHVHDRIVEICRDPFDLTMPLIEAVDIAARDAGCRYLLDGMPGDLLLSIGDSYMANLIAGCQLRSAWREASGARAIYPDFYPSAFGTFLRSIPTAFAPAWARGVKHRLRSPRFADEQVARSAIAPGFARRCHSSQRVRQMLDSARVTVLGDLASRHAGTLRQPWLTVAIERYGRVAAALSVEARHPFLDRRLASFCVALPWHQKRFLGEEKVLLRRAMRGELPDAVVNRHRKTHLGPRFLEAYVDEFRGDLEDLLTTRNARIRDLVSLPKIDEGLRLRGEALWFPWQALMVDRLMRR